MSHLDKYATYYYGFQSKYLLFLQKLWIEERKSIVRKKSFSTDTESHFIKPVSVYQKPNNCKGKLRMETNLLKPQWAKKKKKKKKKTLLSKYIHIAKQWGHFL